MTTEEIIKKAMAGDINAMIIIGDAYSGSGDQIDYDSMMKALPWYERAAIAGNSYGTMQAVLIHNILAIVSEKIPDLKEAITEYEKVIELIGRVFKMQDIDKDTMLSARKEYLKAHYKIARCYYILQEYGMAMIYLNSIEGMEFEEKMLKGLCEYKLAENEEGWRKAYSLLHSIEKQLLSLNGREDMNFLEQMVLAQGYIVLSHIYYFGIGGVPKNIKKAYQIVRAAYQTIMDENIREDLIATELERYK